MEYDYLHTCVEICLIGSILDDEHSMIKSEKKCNFWEADTVFLKDQNQGFLKIFEMKWPLKE